MNTVFITRHAFSCNNLKSKKGSTLGNVLNRATEREPSLTTWGVLQTLARSSDSIYTNPDNKDSIRIFVSCLVRTWFTAILLYGPNYKNITLRVSPYLKEHGETAGNMPIPFRQQVQKLEHFLNYLKVIRTLASEMKDSVSTPLVQIRKIDKLTITLLFSEKDASTRFTINFDLNDQKYSPLNLGYNILSNIDYEASTGGTGFWENVARKTSAIIELPTQNWSTPNPQKQKNYKPELFLTVKEQQTPGFAYNLDLLKLHNVVKTLDIIDRQIRNSEKDVELAQSKPLILLKKISEDKGVTILDDDTSLNKKSSIPKSEEFKEGHIDIFLKWLYQEYSEKDPTETEYHCVAHNNIMTSFIDEYFGSSNPTKKKFHLDEQNTWTLTLGMDKRTNLLDESAKINYGKCQPVKNINGITSACEELCDFGFGTVDRPKHRRDECYNKLYTDFTPVQETCTVGSDSTAIVTSEMQAGNKRSRKNRSKAKRRTRHILRRR
jgi:hypothetical protein